MAVDVTGKSSTYLPAGPQGNDLTTTASDRTGYACHTGDDRRPGRWTLLCFSPEADLVGAVVIGAIGIDTVRHARSRRELPLASIPLLLAGHQFVEAFVWWGLRGTVPAEMGTVAMWIYLLFAFCVLPILIPTCVMGIEPGAKRRRVMAPFLVLGIGVAVTLLVQMIRGPVFAEERHLYLHYQANLTYGGLIVVAYIAAVCAPLLISKYRHVRAFGVANFAAAVFLAWTFQSGFTSVWCAWAAVVSGAIAVHLRLAETHRTGLAAHLRFAE